MPHHPFSERKVQRHRGKATCPPPPGPEVAELGFEPETSLPHSLGCLHKKRGGVALASESREKTVSLNPGPSLSPPHITNKTGHRQRGGQAAKAGGGPRH